jgi:hypothetical protein
MSTGYFIITIAVCPIKINDYIDAEEKSKIKLINPIDSKVIAAGIRYDNNNAVIIESDEKTTLTHFWKMWKSLHLANSFLLVIGFNSKKYDLPFMTTRSFINNIPIYPFLLKNVVDLKEKISAYKYGYVKGMLRDYAKSSEMQMPLFDSKDIPEIYNSGKIDLIKNHIGTKLELIDSVYKRALETNIINIEKW